MVGQGGGKTHPSAVRFTCPFFFFCVCVCVLPFKLVLQYLTVSLTQQCDLFKSQTARREFTVCSSGLANAENNDGLS